MPLRSSPGPAPPRGAPSTWNGPWARHNFPDISNFVSPLKTGYGEPNRTKKSLKKVIPASSATLKKIPAHTASAIRSAADGDNSVKKVKNVVMEFSPENPFLRKRHRRRNKKLLRRRGAAASARST